MNFNPIGGLFNRVTEEENGREALAQLRDSCNLYNDLVSRCYSVCVKDFMDVSLASKEKKCIDQCTEKYFQYSRRVSQEFLKAKATEARIRF